MLLFFLSHFCIIILLISVLLDLKKLKYRIEFLKKLSEMYGWEAWPLNYSKKFKNVMITSVIRHSCRNNDGRKFPGIVFTLHFIFFVTYDLIS
jgi:hypothetical protein